MTAKQDPNFWRQFDEREENTVAARPIFPRTDKEKKIADSIRKLSEFPLSEIHKADRWKLERLSAALHRDGGLPNDSWKAAAMLVSSYKVKLESLEKAAG